MRYDQHIICFFDRYPEEHEGVMKCHREAKRITTASVVSSYIIGNIIAYRRSSVPRSQIFSSTANIIRFTVRY
jgi:hypothetical protein